MRDQTIKILEKQRQDLVVRVLKKHEEMEASRSRASNTAKALHTPA